MATKRKITGANLQYVSKYTATFKKTGATKLHVVTSAKNTGSTLCGILMAAYPGARRYDKGFGWGDFNIIFDSRTSRDEAYDDLAAALAEYRNSEGVDLGNTEPSELATSGNEGNGTGKDYSSYVLLAAAAIVVLLLVLPKRKGR